MKRIAKLCLLGTLIPSAFISADTKSETIEATNTFAQMIKTTDNAPDWLKRTTLDFSVEKDYKPAYELETVQPIYQHSDDDMYFWQFNAMTRDTEQTYNLGLGYRNIIFPEVMLGINTFYDYAAEHGHKRGSVGFEVIGMDYEARTNIYRAISDKKEISTDVFEEVLNGWDVEIGGSIIPMDKDFKMFASYTQFDKIQGQNNYKTMKVRATYLFTDNLKFEVGYIGDDKKYSDISKDRTYATMTLLFGKTKREKLYKDSLKSKLLQPVERENEIIVEQTTTLTVSIKRGN